MAITECEVDVRRSWLRALVGAAAVAATTSIVGPVSQAQAWPVLVFPGMEIHQGTTVCTLGFVDPVTRIAFTAGHCRGDGPVTDRAGNLVGVMAAYRDNTPDGATVDTGHQIADYQAITLVDGIEVNNLLPGGRPLVADPAIVAVDEQPVCHFGIVTGESCGIVESINNGWFTMTNGVVSQKGDSGGPVYVVDPSGRAVIVGLFNSTWGQFPAAVSWEAANAQLREDIGAAAPGGYFGPPA